jgi:hypothetical protein
MQDVGDTHETASSCVMSDPVGTGVDWRAHAVPFQASTIGTIPLSVVDLGRKLPTATQKVADVHETLLKMISGTPEAVAGTAAADDPTVGARATTLREMMLTNAFATRPWTEGRRPGCSVPTAARSTRIFRPQRLLPRRPPSVNCRLP